MKVHDVKKQAAICCRSDANVGRLSSSCGSTIAGSRRSSKTTESLKELSRIAISALQWERETVWWEI